MGEGMVTDPYHIPVVRGAMTRNLASILPDVKEEIMVAFDDVIPVRGLGMSPCHSVTDDPD
jgi:hypothetical protein